MFKLADLVGHGVGKILIIGNAERYTKILERFAEGREIHHITVDSEIGDKIITHHTNEIEIDKDIDLVIMLPDFPDPSIELADLKLFDKDVLDIAKDIRRIIMVPINYNFKRLFQEYDVEKLNIIKSFNECLVEIKK